MTACVARWRARTLLDSPHRLCFFWAGVQWVASALWWFVALLTGAGAAALPAPTLHALWFGLGSMPLFIAGFVLTAGPRWVQAPAVDAAGLRAGVAAFSAGWLLTALGAMLDLRVAAAGQLAAAAGLGLLAWRAARMVRQGARADTLHPRLIVVALALMALAHLGTAAAMGSGRAALLPALAGAALWWGPVAVFVVASHRMLPFLGDGLWPALDRRWPRWPLWLLLSGAVVQGAWAALPVPWRAGGAMLVGTHLGLVFVGSAALTLRWLGAPALRSPLVRWLFVASLWWLLALLLLAAVHWPGLAPDLARRWQLAGLHALTIGYLGGTLLAMATRVTATQQGRSQAVDGHGRALFAVLQGAVVLRVATALWPERTGLVAAAAAFAWLLVAAGWFLRHGAWLAQAPTSRRAGPPAQRAGPASGG
jgi:uncharacterized protein involved in response to NO